MGRGHSVAQRRRSTRETVQQTRASLYERTWTCFTWYRKCGSFAERQRCCPPCLACPPAGCPDWEHVQRGEMELEGFVGEGRRSVNQVGVMIEAHHGMSSHSDNAPVMLVVEG
jgi:hypothetical protein